MDVHEFHKDFLEEVKATAATEGSGSNAAFVSVASSYLVNAEVLSDFTAAFYLGKSGSKKLRVDGYVLDEFDYTFNLIIADYIESGLVQNEPDQNSHSTLTKNATIRF